VSTTITRRLFEGFAGNGGLFARRRVREQGNEKGLGQTWRSGGDGDPLEHLHRAVGAAISDHDYDAAGKLIKHLQANYGQQLEEEEEEEEPEGPEDFEDESQAGRGEPEKPYGVYNTASSERGKESMESREAKVRRYLDHGEPHHRSPLLLESRRRKSPRQIAAYAARLLRGD
jgi:hypothetical protein